MGFAALFFVRLQRGVLFPCLQRGLFPCLLPDGSLPQCRHPLRHGTPGQQPRHGTSCQQFRYGAPASNTPHPAEKSTPVWLAIWHTWAGFANSQHRDAAFATPDNICAHSSLLQTLSSCSDRRKSVGPSAPIAYATSVSPPDEAAAWLGRRCRVLDMAAAWPGAAFLQITARTNPCSRHLWGTLARAVASICAHRAPC